MNAVLENIIARRSVRAYSERRLSEVTIKEVLKAGVYAPSWMNAQPLRFVVIENRERIDHFSGVAKEMFIAGISKDRPKNEPVPEKVQSMIRMLSNPDFNIFYHAPVAVFVFVHPSALTPVEDGCTAVENMFLYARSIGVGSCWIGFANSLSHSTEFMRECQVPSDHKMVAQFILGYPKGDFPEGKRSDPQVLSWIK